MQVSAPKRILIICHEASFTGAPVLLLELVRFMVKERKDKLRIVIVRGGKLEKEFEKWGKTTVLKPEGYSEAKGLSKLGMIIRNRLLVVSTFYQSLRSDLIFSNSIVNGFVLDWLRFSGRSIYTYVHELKSVIDLYLQQGNAKGSFRFSHFFLYPCNAVKNNLIENYQVDPGKLKRLNYYFENPGIVEQAEQDQSSGITVCGAGTVSRRKGTDLFIEIAKKVKTIDASVRFVWFGSFEDKESEHHYRKLSMLPDGTNVIDFGGFLSPEMMRKQYKYFDVLLLTSREDPYPLVVIEAAFSQKPALVFEEGGGITEFVEGCGWILKNTDSMAETILQTTKEQFHQKGILARDKALNLHANKLRLTEQLAGIFSSL